MDYKKLTLDLVSVPSVFFTFGLPDRSKSSYVLLVEPLIVVVALKFLGIDWKRAILPPEWDFFVKDKVPKIKGAAPHSDYSLSQRGSTMHWHSHAALYVLGELNNSFFGLLIFDLSCWS